MIDLDETLIHSEDFTYGNVYDFVFEMDNPSLGSRKDVLADNLENRSVL
jgi:hypothetical protein